jgi:hypothetical protein
MKYFYGRFLMSLFFVFLLALVLVACNQVNSLPMPTENINDTAITPKSVNNPAILIEPYRQPTAAAECIPPLETFAYPVLEKSSDPVPGKDFQVYPPIPWKNVASLENAQGLVALKMIRMETDHTEIWILISLPDKRHEFRIFYPESGGWKTISAETKFEGIHIEELFMGPDNTLWGSISAYKPEALNVSPPSFLSKYNEDTEQFEFENALQSIPLEDIDSLGYAIPPQIRLDRQGTFWIFASGDAIYSYNPKEQLVNEHIKIPDIEVSDPIIAPDNTIYFTHFNTQGHPTSDCMLTNRCKEILHFMPNEKRLEQITFGIIDPGVVITNLLVDHAGNLWVGGVAWLNPSGKWYRIFDSPVFLRNFRWSSVEERWQAPYIIMESSDGRLWFRSDNGMTWLDPEKGEWCWFTTEQSNIVEDQEHNLWMVADNKLYKLELEP